MNKIVLSLILTFLMVCMPCGVQAQVYNEMDADGNINQYDESGTKNFNPNNRDSIKGEKDVPKGVWVWTVDRRFGDIRPAELDTMPHLYQNSIYNTGLYGEYNTTGNNYSPRLSRIFIDRKPTEHFFFIQPYDYTTKQPEDFLFTNTLSPYTHLTYDNCGDKQHGEDHIDAKFAVNANKRLGFGFDLDYYYGMGYYQSQSNANFRASLFGSYRGDRYQMHLLASTYHRKNSENGGIQNDNLITHPELETVQYTEDEIPTVLTSNWNRNNSLHLFLTHRYNLGFYRKVKMTDEEIKARQFAEASKKKMEEKENNESSKKDKPRGRKSSEPINEPKPMGRPKDAKIMGDEPVNEKPAEIADTTRIQVQSQAELDSLNRLQAIQDSIDATMKKEYVPVTSIIHTLDINSYDRIYHAYKSPANYYADTFFNTIADDTYPGDSIYDQHKYLTIKNTVGLALLEGFNKYVKAGLKLFASFEYRKFKMPDLVDGTTRSELATWSEHCTNIGAQLSKTQGKTLHFNLAGELGVTGADAGSLAVDFNTDLNFALFGDTIQLAANAYFHRTKPVFFLDKYHSKHLWWDQSLNSETRTHIEGIFNYRKSHTQLRIALDEIQNYTYFGMSYTLDGTARKQMTAGVYQSSGNLNVLTAQLRQDIRWGIFNWENIVTYQNSNSEALPLPDLNVWSNLYLKFKIARVLTVELGGCVTYFTKYYAPDYSPQLNQFAVQQNADSRIEIGNYPWVDVYANMHLKRTRFFVAYSHINGGSGTKNYFLTPHYPTNGRIMHMGVSWNFFN